MKTTALQKEIGHFRSPSAEQTFRHAYDEAMRVLPTPTAIYDVPTSFGIAHIFKFGSNTATPIVLLPGRTASTPMWEANLAALIQHRTVYSVDLIGEPGMSVQTRPFTNANDQSVWLHETLDGIGLHKAHIVGVSIGGWSAVNLALYKSDHIASLTLLDPAFVFGYLTWKVIVVSLGSALPFMPNTIRMKLLSWISGGAEANENVPVARLIASGMRDYASKLPAPTYPTDEQLQSINVPVLALIAGRSIIHDPQKAEARARKLLRKGHVELWPDASHAINGEFPGRINQTILDFIRRVETGSS